MANREPHVCHITSAHPMLKILVFYRECVSLKKVGFKVTLVANTNGNNKINQVQGVQIVPLPQYRFTFARRLIGAWLAACLAAKTRADLYHFHDPELIPAMRLLSRRTRKRLFGMPTKAIYIPSRTIILRDSSFWERDSQDGLIKWSCPHVRKISRV